MLAAVSTSVQWTPPWIRPAGCRWSSVTAMRSCYAVRAGLDDLGAQQLQEPVGGQLVVGHAA